MVAGCPTGFVIETFLETQREFLKLQLIDRNRKKHHYNWHMKFGTQNHDGEVANDDLLDGQCVTKQGFQDDARGTHDLKINPIFLQTSSKPSEYIQSRMVTLFRVIEQFGELSTGFLVEVLPRRREVLPRQ